ncbi:lipid A biosynthesis acyltransferase [Flavobacterium agricola]|uniref:Lipid A biosynthesis acyltransferase n=1 Tax=Flavobacterium agricola TaxID=2870839 RepID=A0ABY6LXE7_9FLAO|nr:lipid A biosynthesis acyltransferase [Flavobacterium agricola]UYW01009.1 lipid A biosynthesis acyltransferase [Flavobacterium agricola]
MAQWSGKSKGTVLGYKIFVYCIKNLGIKAAYTVLVFVAFYYVLTSWKSNGAIYDYLKNKQKFSTFKAFFGVYKSYFTFGQVLIDKVAINAGLRHKFTYDFDGISILKNLLAQKKGGVLISAHVGNFEIAEHFFADIDFECQINLVTSDLEHSAIKNYLDSLGKKSAVKFIIIKEDLSHIFEINHALSNNELICFTGDRYFEGTKVLENDLLGANAKFAAGPFLIASRLKVPVAFVYVMKEPNLHYHLYTREAQFKQRDAQALLQEYCTSVASVVKKYPYQWFNFFKFWNT